MSHPYRHLRHPGVERYLEARARSWHARVADLITAFAGSMPFVYVHVAAFVAWMVLRRAEPVADPDPGGLARGDLPVDLRAHRPEPPGGRAQAKADHDFVEQELELKTNTELTREVRALLVALEARLPADAGDQGPAHALTGAPVGQGRSE